MFQPQLMCKIQLVVPELEVVAVTEALAASGVFHPLLPGNEALRGGKNEWQEWANTFSNLERRILLVMNALGAGEEMAPEGTPHLIDPEVVTRDVERLEEEAQTLVQQLEDAQSRVAELQRYVRQLEPLASLESDLEQLRALRYVNATFGTMPVNNLERFRTSLEQLPFVLLVLRRDSYLATVALFGARQDVEILDRAARSAYLTPIHIPEQYHGTPAAVIAELRQGIEAARAQVSAIQAQIHQLQELRVRHLRFLLWRVRVGRKLTETIARYDRMRYTYIVEGWVPEEQVQPIRQQMAAVSDKVLIEITPLPRHTEGIPVAFANPPLLHAFEGLVTNYGHPSYGELDPTFLIALTFPLIFGIMFGDVGHGLLLLALGALLLSRWIPALRGLAGLGPIVAACGAAAGVFGFLYGSIFGFEDILHPLWLHPLEEITSILIATVGVGVGVLTLGMLCNIVNAALAHNWKRMVFDHNGLAGLTFYWSLLGLGAAAMHSIAISPLPFVGITLLSGLILTFAELLERLLAGRRPLVRGNWGIYVLQASFELFETLIGLLSNTLSYVRMGAFAVAHGALSMVVFIMAEMVSPAHGLGYWLVVILGNLFVVGFEGMIVVIQTLRLEYYEFFSKFFSGSGIPFHPLTLVLHHESESGG